jgi:hypothetical protein
VQACEKDCVLDRKFGPWSKKCSKACDGGSVKRVRRIKEPAKGEGECPASWSKTRLEYKSCNEFACELPPTEVLKCNETLDVMLLMDSAPNSGKDAWRAEVVVAEMLIDAFDVQGNQAEFSLITYTGPRTWFGVSKCVGEAGPTDTPISIEKDCHIEMKSTFTGHEEEKKAVEGSEYQAGTKLLSLALGSAKDLLMDGRKTARTVVIVLMDGMPFSFRKVRMASRAIRKKARLVYVPIVKFSPLKAIKSWASRRWQENIVKVESAVTLAYPETGTRIIANICPDPIFPPTEVMEGALE